MKLKLLFLSLLGTITIANAQYTVTDTNGEVLNNGDVIEYGTTLFPDASYDFVIFNDNENESIFMRIEYVEAKNANNTNFAELCFGLCMNDVAVGATVPLAPQTIELGIGQDSGAGNHFYSDDSGNGTDMVDFIFKFHQLLADGVTEVGTPLTFTYRYNPTLGIKDNNKVDLVIESTIISNSLNLKVNEPMSMMVYDLKGRVVKQVNLEVGRQNIDMSNLSAQAYLLQFKNEKGGTQSTKVIVK